MTERTTSWLCVGLVALIASLEPALAHAQSPLASGELEILGAQLVVSPADQTVPKNQATALTVQLVDAADSFSALPIAGLGALFVKGTLTGPGVDAPRELSIDISTPPANGAGLLPIPPLVVTGNYVVDDLRVEPLEGRSSERSRVGVQSQGIQGRSDVRTQREAA
jgi:hypothetical protein